MSAGAITERRPEQPRRRSHPRRILALHVDELVVVGITHSRGAKREAKDALGLAQPLRLGAIHTSVFKAPRTRPVF